MQDLLQKLLSTGLFSNQLFLTKYIELIQKNLTTPKITGQTQKHHIFPKCLSNRLGIAINDTVVNLYYKDHILAHYYLIYATEDRKLKIANIHAFNHLLKFQGHWLEEEILKDFLIKQQVIYEQTHALRVAHNKEVNSGGCYVNNGIKAKHIKLEELDLYLANGWKRGQIQQHDKNRGTVTINNGQTEKRIPANELEIFIQNGWLKGKIRGYKKSGKTNLNKIAVYSLIDQKELRINNAELKEFLINHPNYIIGSKPRKPYQRHKN